VHALIEEICRIGPARNEVSQSVGADAQIRSNPPDFLVIKSAQLLLPLPPIADTGKQRFDGGMGRH